MSNGTRVICPSCWAKEENCTRCNNDRLVLSELLTPQELDAVYEHIAEAILCKTCGQVWACRCPIPEDE